MFRHLATVVVLIMLPGASAQGLFVSDENLAAGATGDTTYALTATPPAGEESFKDYIATGFGALTYTTAFEYTVESTFTATGPSTWTAYISCDQPTAFRPGNQNDDQDTPTMRVHLFAGASEVAVDRKYELRTCDGPDDVWEAVFALDATGTVFEAGSTVRVENIIWVPTGAPGTGAENVYILGGSIVHPSGLTGPGLPGVVVEQPTAPVAINLTGDFRQTFEAPHNLSYVLNFTTDGTQQLDLSVAPTAGNVTVRITAAGTEVYDRTINATAQELVDVAAGNGSVRLDYAGFTGELALSFQAPPDEGQGNMTQDDAVLPGNTTGSPNGTADDDEESPAWPFLLPLIVALVLRRRRD